MMSSEQQVEDETSSSVPTVTVNGPLSQSDASVGPGTKATVDTSPRQSRSFIPEPAAPPMPAEESKADDVLHHAISKADVVQHHANSAPSSVEAPGGKVQDSVDETQQSPKAEISEKATSLQTVDPILLPPNGQLSPLSENESEEFINSPRGQNVIVERSPGGRYVRFMEKLGSGASKDVYRAYDTTEGIEVAWNVVNLAGVPKAERNRIVNEVRLLERLHHHNIISFHGSWVNRERQEVNFVTEILSSGTLKSFIDKVQVIRWKIAKRWARQILNGLAYLHEQDPPVIHRDLKCDNIFINGTSGDLRIGDFGLSTVHRNGKVLSVLGTPEFMAPDLYEESSYDEKVDVYAFGLVLLEIFTKDIPYRECVNPAQIYRKVMRGEPPGSLARVRRKEARDFITLCLGYKDETGKYVRPSAVELLKHPFLGAAADDDSEVEVDPPLQERGIREETGEQETQRARQKGVTTKIQIPAPPPASAESTTGTESASKMTTPMTTPVHSPLVRREGKPPRPNHVHARQNSMDDDSDHFEEMPDSEVNIVKKVKVLMGRGQELENTSDDLPILDTTPLVSNVGEPTAGRPHSSGHVSVGSTSSRTEESIGGNEPVTGQAPHLQVAQPHYLVAAAVIEEESSFIRQYEDDILKLIIRLPVEGQTQNVQFDFHLVEDDPVQVAKEMVAELSIPQEAVLEISETISGLARTARMKQDKHRQKLQQEQMMAQKVQHQGMQQLAGKMHLVQQQPQHMNQNLQVNEYSPPQVPSEEYEGSSSTHHQIPHGAAVGSHHHPPAHSQAPNLLQPGEGLHVSHPHLLSSRSISGGQQQQQPMYTVTAAAPSRDSMPVNSVHAAQQQVQTHSPVQPVSHESPAAGQTYDYVQGAVASSETARQTQSIVQTMTQVEDQSKGLRAQPQHVQATFLLPSVQKVTAPSEEPRQAQSIAQTAIKMEDQSKFVQAQLQPLQPAVMVPPAELSVAQAEAQTFDSKSRPLVPRSENGGYESSREVGTMLMGESNSRLEEDASDDDDNDDEAEFKEEMRRLDEDFKKNMLRAQKVFDSRMDNLQRSKEEREAQHLKTLEKHEKERAEFEKRLLQAEKEQNRRIEELQREWDKKREKLAKHRKLAVVEVAAHTEERTMSEMSRSKTELDSLTFSSGREKLNPPTYRSSDSDFSISSSSNGDSGSNSGRGGVIT